MATPVPIDRAPTPAEAIGIAHDTAEDAAATLASIAAGSPTLTYDTGKPRCTCAWASPEHIAHRDDRLSTWHGTPILRVTSRRIYRGNIGRLVAITAVDESGRSWHGRHSVDNCQCVIMRAGKR